MRFVLLSETNSKFGAPILERLAAYPGATLAGVVTRAPGVLCDYYVGDAEPVDLPTIARHRGIPANQPVDVNSVESVRWLRERRPDYLFIGNYQQILRPEVLAVPRVGTVNLHPGPLPRYAGLAPFFWMAKVGETAGGTSLVWTAKEIDGGPLVAQRHIVLSGTETAGQIMDLHFRASWQLLDDTLPSLLDRTYTLTPQAPAARTYFGRPEEEHRRIDWARPTAEIIRTVRACAPRPGALAVTKSGASFRVLSADSYTPRHAAVADPGELRVFDRGTLAVRAVDGWIAITSLGLLGQGLSVPEVITDVPALLTTLDLGEAPEAARRGDHDRVGAVGGGSTRG